MNVEEIQTNDPFSIDPTSFDGLLDDTINNTQSLARKVDQLQAALDAIYAPIAKGVTNGDSHDHNGGDGAQIDHVNLASIGTNTHAQLDTHLALTRWITVPKTENETRTSDTAIAADNTLKFTIPANGKATIRGRVYFSAHATPDIKYRLNVAGVTPAYAYIHIKEHFIDQTDRAPAEYSYSAFPTATTTLTSPSTNYGVIEFSIVIHSDGTQRDFTFQWAQNTSSINPTTVREGSYIEYILTE